VSVLAYVFAFVSTPVPLTMLMIFFRVVVLVSLRSKRVRKYFDVTKIIR
jgi:hypothetical protein